MNPYSRSLCLGLLLLLVMAGIPAASALVNTEITSVTPISAPNNGVVTITINGVNFDASSTTWLVKCGLDGGGGGYISGTIVKRTGSTQMVATYDLTNAKVGDYTIRVKTLDDGPAGYTLGELYKSFVVYKASGGSGSSGTTTTTTTTEPKTYATEETGDNSVFFETNPPGATVYVDGVEVGTSTFTYNTYKDGVHDVLIKKIGYEDYSDRVTIVENDRVRFYALLTPLSPGSSTTPVTTGVNTATTGKPQTNVTTVKKSTLKMPTPLGTDPPLTEEAPADPATVLLAAGIGIAIVVFRRR